MRGIARFVDIMEAAEGGRLRGVEFDDDLLGDVAKSGGSADGGGEHNLTTGENFAGFHDGELHLAQETVAHGLRQLGEMHIKELNLAGIDFFAEIGVRLVRRAEKHGVSLG